MASQAFNEQPLYTCLSCSIAFLSPEDQRDHYKSDHHRYNMKRRVAGLPPVSVTVFNQKVVDRKAETAIMTSLRGSVCEVCNKVYTTENAYRSHIQSKKHKENEIRAANKTTSFPPSAESAEVLPAPGSAETAPVPAPASDEALKEPTLSDIEKKLASLAVNEDATEDEINQTIDEKIAAARARFSTSHCLFCPHQSDKLSDILTHMSTHHSFFIPDAEYLVDIVGLITYLGEKIVVGNVCIYCNDKGKEFRTLDAVRKHMVDKSHCKIAYDTEDDRLEVSTFYDFTSSYPTTKPQKKLKISKFVGTVEEGWEDVEDDDNSDSVDEIVDDDTSDGISDSEEADHDDEIPDSQIMYGDSHLELVLPSGARIGHRSLKRYYTQSFPAVPRGGKPEDPNSGAALVRRLLADKNSALVSRTGGFGAYGKGTELVKARNRGEAREAGRHVREFRDQRRREEFKTRVGFIHNSQKHYRDPLLQ